VCLCVCLSVCLCVCLCVCVFVCVKFVVDNFELVGQIVDIDNRYKFSQTVSLLKDFLIEMTFSLSKGKGKKTPLEQAQKPFAFRLFKSSPPLPKSRLAQRILWWQKDWASWLYEGGKRKLREEAKKKIELAQGVIFCVFSYPWGWWGWGVEGVDGFVGC